MGRIRQLPLLSGNLKMVGSLFLLGRYLYGLGPCTLEPLCVEHYTIKAAPLVLPSSAQSTEPGRLGDAGLMIPVLPGVPCTLLLGGTNSTDGCSDEHYHPSEDENCSTDRDQGADDCTHTKEDGEQQDGGCNAA